MQYKEMSCLAIHDISGVGKCSLTVALPVLSCCGVETSVLPTAVLSTHTGGFTGFTYRDLTGDILPMARHWKSLGCRFQALYTGFLGSEAQIGLVEEMFDWFGGEDTLILVDPVMGDHGRLYSGFTPDFPKAMAKLCARADLIVPNLTEAVFLLGEEYREHYTEEEIKALLVRLAGLGTKNVILTGVSFRAAETGAMAYSAETGRFFSYYNENVPSTFHGTGDIFASVCTGALTHGLSLEQTVQLAVDFTLSCIQATAKNADDRWYGVNFEVCIPKLIKRLEQIKDKGDV